MSEPLSLRLPETQSAELVSRAKCAGLSKAAYAQKLLEAGLREEGLMDEMRSRLADLEEQWEETRRQNRLGITALLRGVAYMGTPKRLTPEQVEQWLRRHGFVNEKGEAEG